MGLPAFVRFSTLLVAGTGAAAVAFTAAAAVAIEGQVVDLNGQPVAGAQVVFDRRDGAPGASVVTVFTSADGRFAFPGRYPETERDGPSLTLRALDHEQVGSRITVDDGAGSDQRLHVLLLARPRANQADVAPASAWLARITDRAQQSKFVMDCIDCHQVPSSEVRHYAGLVADVHAPDAELAREQSWAAIVKYMNYLSSWEFSRGSREPDQKVDTDAVYAVDNGAETAQLLARIFDDRLEHLTGYSWGAPLIATPSTAIWEYEIPHPNAVREALLLGDPAKLWVADVSANRMFAVDIVTGEQDVHEVPSEALMSPHSLHRGSDGSLWITPLFNSIVAHLDIASGEWRTWRLRTDDGRSPGIHDLSFGDEHELLTDSEGRIWFSDIGNNAVGYFDPRGGHTEIWNAPPSPGRAGRTALYGLIMTGARDEVWYSQLGNGTVGGFDIESEEFIGPIQLPDRNAGPRRITITDGDVIYFALYGSGQLAELDARTREVTGLYDLPDTASAPYSATWDPVRRVVWIATANGDVIYRFDPETKAFGVLSLPREQAFLRMIDIDPRTGVLITSYANIVDIVQGPRMALIIDPGDGAYPERFTLADPAGLPARSAERTTVGMSRYGAETARRSRASDGARLVGEARCDACHRLDEPSLGPPYVAIAARHAPNKDVMVDVLAHKIVHGGGGNWGLVPMVPNQWVSADDARAMAEWILGLAEDQARAR